jgi:cobalamin biosynthesis protein CobD/CbiB
MNDPFPKMNNPFPGVNDRRVPLFHRHGGRYSLFSFVRKYGYKHGSPHSGYPEAALSGIPDCRFGRPNSYFGKMVNKPYIRDNEVLMALFVVYFILIVNLLSNEVLCNWYR